MRPIALIMFSVGSGRGYRQPALAGGCCCSGGKDAPSKRESITYEIIVDSDESDRRLELLHDVKKFGTVFNTVAPVRN